MFGFFGARAKKEKAESADKRVSPGAQEKPQQPEKRSHAITDYAGGGATRRRMEALDLKNGGMVRGPGTGTSDDIETEVPEGSYIMPADSTQQLGEETLAGLGFEPNVPVNLSNGEYQLPPEQVHAVGVQALDQMRNATHTPVPERKEPELFFANGGEVEEEPRRRGYVMYGPRGGPATPASTPAPAAPVQPTPAAPSGTAAGFKIIAGGAALPFAAGIDAIRSGGARLIGGDPNTLEGGPNKYTDAAAATFSQGEREGREVAERLRGEARDVLGVQAAQPVQQAARANSTPRKQSAQPEAAPSTKAPAPSAPSPRTAPAAPTMDVAGTDLQSAATTAQPEALPGGITREGNSYFGGEGATALGGVSRSPQNEAAVQALLDRTPEFGQGAQRGGRFPDGTPYPIGAPVVHGTRGFQPEGPRVIGMTDSSQQDRVRQAVIANATTPFAGAQNGQLTASQRASLDRLAEGDSRSASAAQGHDARLQETSMREQGATQRAAMQEAGASGRAAATNELQRRRFDSDQEARGFELRAARRLEQLQEAYQSSAPDQRSAIAQQIRELGGRDAQNRFTVVPGGQEIDPTTQQLVTRPSMVFNNQTGQFVPQQQGGGAQTARPVGTRSTVNGKTAVWDGSKWVPQGK